MRAARPTGVAPTRIRLTRLVVGTRLLPPSADIRLILEGWPNRVRQPCGLLPRHNPPVPSTLTASIAEWALSVRPDQVPDDVKELARLQVMSVLGASHAGERSVVGRKVAAASGRWHPYGDLFARLSWSVVHDYDDYLFAGHTGHSAVWTVMGEARSAPADELLTSIVVGNELGGRLGAALLLGPQNGQMWAYIHALIACCVAGRLRGVDAGVLRNAIGIAFAMPHYPLMPGFMGPESKAVIAAFPALQGLMALDLAQEGMTGAHDILGARDGFIRAVGRLGRRSAFDGLGEVWLTRTLCFKLYPGCAYVDTAVDALRSLELNAADVRGLEVRAHPFTLAMERESERHRRAGVPEPVTVTFNVKLSLALTLLDGEPSPESLEPKVLAERWPEIGAVAGRIRLRPAIRGTLAALRRSARLLSIGTLDTTDFRMEFPAEVRVELADGSTRTASASVPLGGAGRPREETARLVLDKFTRNGGTEDELRRF